MCKSKKTITNYHDNIICFQKYETAPPDGTKEDWATAFRNVYHKIEMINHTTYNYSTFRKRVMKGAVNRNTIANWLKGKTLPDHREDVIKLGITAGYNEAEMNNLLLAAGKNMLFMYVNLIRQLFQFFVMHIIFILQSRTMISAEKHLPLLICYVTK